MIVRFDCDRFIKQERCVFGQHRRIHVAIGILTMVVGVSMVCLTRHWVSEVGVMVIGFAWGGNSWHLMLVGVSAYRLRGRDKK